VTQGIAKLVAPWNKCLKLGENYIEKERDSNTNKSDPFFRSGIQVPKYMHFMIDSRAFRINIVE